MKFSWGIIILGLIAAAIAYELYKKHMSAQSATTQSAAEAGVYDLPNFSL